MTTAAAKRQGEKAQHTPGPWKVGARYGTNKLEVNAESTGNAVATVWAFEPKMVQREGSPDRADYVPSAEGHANAALVAAAPDLLEQLKDAVSACTKLHGKGKCLGCEAWQAAIMKAGAR